MGGAVKVGHALGAKDLSQARIHFSSTTAMALIIIVLLTLISSIFFDQLLGLLNRDRTLFDSIEQYPGTILWFYSFMILNDFHKKSSEKK